MAFPGEFRQVMAGVAGVGEVRFGSARSGEVWQAGFGLAGLGMAGHGEARFGSVSHVKAR
jgi:hypothetical protein